MDSTSLQYKLTLETSSDRTVMLQDGVRPIDMKSVLSTNIGFSPAMFPSALKTAPSGRSHGLYSEDISSCGSHGNADREIVAISPEAVPFTANQLQSDSHISLLSNCRHNPCIRGELPTNSSIYQNWALEYPRAAPAQIQTDPNDLDTSAFSYSQCYGTPISGEALHTTSPSVPMHLALGFTSQWSTSQNPENRRRKKRIPYSKQQIAELEKAFEKNRFLTPEIRLNISFKLGLTERQVKIWFQNQRQKEKKLRVQQPIHPSCPGL
ncbi:homeobox protein Hox-D12-like [Pristis pectinata]|uniref:homeobox protein Hox-D12-like n=1 Tax=Pristis pectinata TaxID=685728 RepID=UPI00223DF774|nr:homeobox protein Hox-D12-like [Pristis pectinata]